MAKDKKGAAAKKAAKAAKAAKQEKKATKKDKKLSSKAKSADDSDEESVDLDAVLAAYQKEQEQYHAITETVSEAPSPRTAATLLPNPANDNELFLFGGEYFNGATAHFYNDLFVYNTKTDIWKRVTSPNSPLPRSGHAWCRGGNTKDVYLFGGEFSSPKQGTFYHYNDFWRLDPATREWTRIESKGKAGGPPARSGHRMVGFKQYILLFGGFQDTSSQTKYLNDVWVYDCTTFQWHCPVLPAARAKPDARSSFSFLPHDQGAVLYGGYSRVKTAAGGKGGQQQQGKGKGKTTGGGGGGPSRMIMKPKVHEDTWFLRIEPPAAESAASALPKVSWERRKKPANPPNPPRAGATMAFHKGRGIMFGGVHDVEESEEGIDSEFFNTLFVWNIERNRYMPLSLRRPKANAKKAVQEQKNTRRGRGKADEEELLANLKALEMRANAGNNNTDDMDENMKDVSDSEDDEPQVEKPRIFEFPHPRFNAQLAVQSDIVYIYGGTFEKGDREYTFDEMWAIDLNKLDGVKEIFHRELEDWQGEESEDEDEEDEDEEDEDEEMEDEVFDQEAQRPDTPASSIAPSIPEQVEESEAPISALSDDPNALPHPRPFESLREFYARTNTVWQDIIISELNAKNASAATLSDINAMTPKEIKKAAFERAEEKWWDCREEIRALEDEQESAGIGEVVSLAEKEGGGGGVGGVGRRR